MPIISNPFTKSLLLSKIKNLEHGFSNSYCDQSFKAQVASAKQIHKDTILWVNQFEKAAHEADAIGTKEKNLPVGVFTADCAPILLVALDQENLALAILAVHAGWRGTALGIVCKALESLLLAQPEARKILAAIGPSISKKAFEVGEEVVSAFPNAEAHGIADFLRIEGERKKYLFDLPGENRRQIELIQKKFSLPIEIDQLPDCTYFEKEKYPSYRRDREQAGRMLSFLLLKE